jgi:hypothetical protein
MLQHPDTRISRRAPHHPKHPGKPSDTPSGSERRVDEPMPIGMAVEQFLLALAARYMPTEMCEQHETKNDSDAAAPVADSQQPTSEATS